MKTCLKIMTGAMLALAGASVHAGEQARERASMPASAQVQASALVRESARDAAVAPQVEDIPVEAMPVEGMTAADGRVRSARGQWVYKLVRKWGPHVREAYGVPIGEWAASMASVFAKAPLSALEQAAQARSFDAMNQALLGGRGQAQTLSQQMARHAGKAGIDSKALGDAAADLVYVPVTPCRILDTRIAGGPIPANSFRDFDLTDVIRYAPQGGDTSNCNVGDKGSFAAAAINFTVVNPNVAGYITAFPYLASQPNAATINYVAGDIRNALAITRLDQSSATYEFSVYSFAQTHLVADIVGYFVAPEATALECVTVSSAQATGRGAATVDSPACPVGYAIVSGSCDSNAALYQSMIQSNAYKCSTWYPGSSTALLNVTSHARCCRIPGR